MGSLPNVPRTSPVRPSIPERPRIDPLCLAELPTRQGAGVAAADREFIAERIDETLEQEAGFSQSPFATPELAQAWADEVERRIDMIDKGLVKPLPADVALREARQHLERRRAGRAAS